MQSRDEVVAKLKHVMVEALLMKREPGSIPNDGPLFGPNSLGLDSIDALQLVVALEKEFGVAIRDAAQAQKVFQSVDCIADYIIACQSGTIV